METILLCEFFHQEHDHGEKDIHYGCLFIPMPLVLGMQFSFERSGDYGIFSNDSLSSEYNHDIYLVALSGPSTTDSGSGS